MHSHIDVSHAQSQEHVIWIHYIVVWNNSCKYPDFYHYSDVNFLSSLLTFMTEVSYHIILKYENKVLDKDVLSSQTVEKMHLLACYFDKTTIFIEIYLRFVFLCMWSVSLRMIYMY